MREPSEDELDGCMARLSQGERSAFDPLFRALYPRALRFARARLGPDRAADAAQGALERVFARASEFTSGRPVLPWFYAVLTNEVRAIARSDRTGEQQDPADLWSAPEDDPERLLVEREMAHALEEAITSLDAPAAQVIGAVLGRCAPPEISAPAFRKRVSRAYARLRILLGESGGE